MKAATDAINKLVDESIGEWLKCIYNTSQTKQQFVKDFINTSLKVLLTDAVENLM